MKKTRPVLLPALLSTVLTLLVVSACGDRQRSKPKPLFIDQASVAELQSALQSGELTARALTEHYLERIRQLDQNTRAVVEINPDALALAEQLDSERAAGRLRSPLHGIPVLLKDNIDTADRMKTTAGSLALLAAPRPERDAQVVSQLREAGVVILGKTNLSEWANFRSTRSSSGWSARGGQTRNAHDLALTPCGSSSGSAVAVAAGLAPLAVGTETDGSIICPASHNSVVGIKPTWGLVSTDGVIPIAHSLDTVGAMARSVADAAALLSVMADARSASSMDRPQHALHGTRIGVMRSLFERNPALDQLMQARLADLDSAGATLVDLDVRPDAALAAAQYQLLLFEFKHGLNQYLQQRGGFYQSLEHLIRFNEVNRQRQMPYFGQEIFYQAQAMNDLQDPAYTVALDTVQQRSRRVLDEALQAHALDAIVAPSNGPGWLIDPMRGDDPASVRYVSSSALSAMAGYPAITVPAGDIGGRPVGISFMGSAGSDTALIAMAHDFEQRTRARLTPQ